MKPQQLLPGCTWGECLCPDIDPSDRPCPVCEARYGTLEAKRRLQRLMEGPTRIFSDSKRHLVCFPFSIRKLHEVAAQLGIKRCWFHAGRLPHYDIPKRRVVEITAKTEVVSDRAILAIVKGQPPPPRSRR